MMWLYKMVAWDALFASIVWIVLSEQRNTQRKGEA